MVYVDDLAFAPKQPKDFAEQLRNLYNFKIKVADPIKFYLGADSYHNSNGLLCMAPQKYIKCMTQTYEQMFGLYPSQKCYLPFGER